MKKSKKNILLNPGPANTTLSVKKSQIVPDICPREKDFGEVLEWVSRELVKIVGDVTKNTAVIFGGSGTAALEAIISSVINGGKILIINNGAYGERIKQIARIHSIDFIEFISPPDDAIDFKKLEEIIKKHSGDITHLSVIHNETTTGLLNDINTVGDICKKYGIIFIVDAMSSFGAIPVNMERMNINYLAASSNKNIQGMPGISFVIANIKSLEKIKRIKPRTLYLDLYAQYFFFRNEKQIRFTPPVQTIYALKQAIIELKKEGIKQRYKRYSDSWKILIRGIEELGLRPVVPVEYQSRIITAIYEPEIKNYNFDEMHNFLYKQGFTIYPGKIGGKNTFRIANIGAIDYKDIREFLVVFKKYLKKIRFIP